MSQHRSRISTSQQESRISRLEKRDADQEFDSENEAPIPSPIHLERPSDLLTILEEAVSRVRNDRRSTDVAKGRALAHIVAKAAGILPLVEAENAKAEDPQIGLGVIFANDPELSRRAADALRRYRDEHQRRID
jgi:hypothetical protein